MTETLPLRQRIVQAVETLQREGVGEPEIGLILGTGMGTLAEKIHTEVEVCNE